MIDITATQLQVVCVECKKCNKLGTKNMTWKAAEDGKTEELYCTCGSKEWKFVQKRAAEITGEVLIVQRGI